MHRFSIAILVVITNASCFSGEFLAGTACERDSECSPRYVCLFPTGTTSGDDGAMRDPTTGTGGDAGATTGGPTGLCGAADLTPPPPPKTTSQPSDTTGTGTGTDTGGS